MAANLFGVRMSEAPPRRALAEGALIPSQYEVGLCSDVWVLLGHNTTSASKK